jgi:hypothetical protein
MAKTYREKKAGILQFDEEMGSQQSTAAPYFVALCDESVATTQVPINGMMGEYLTLLQPYQINVYEHGPNDANLKQFKKLSGVHIMKEGLDRDEIPEDVDFLALRDDKYEKLYAKKKKKVAANPGIVSNVRQAISDAIAPEPKVRHTIHPMPPEKPEASPGAALPRNSSQRN